MRVRLLVDVSGTRDGLPWPPRGNEVNLPDDEARQMVEALQAIPVSTHRSAETAVAADPTVEQREVRVADERPLTTETGPGPARKGAKR